MPIAANIHYTAYKLSGNVPVVLLHGAGGSHLSWPPQIRRLPDHPTFALDLPGHGKSSGNGYASIDGYVESVLDWMAALDIQIAAFIGHSMGSAIAQQLAIEHAEQVLGIGLIGSGARLRVNPALLQACAEENKIPQAIEQIVAWSFSAGMPENLKALVASRLAEIRPSVILRDLIACDQHDASASLSQIRCPTLILSGGEDKMTPVRLATHLAEQIPQAQLAILPGAGHMVMLERPLEVEIVLRRFLAGFLH
jgi:pimeloyl-ACP methyl ester carboxylesterase